VDEVAAGFENFAEFKECGGVRGEFVPLFGGDWGVLVEGLRLRV
jgi:hypothetical protein